MSAGPLVEDLLKTTRGPPLLGGAFGVQSACGFDVGFGRGRLAHGVEAAPAGAVVDVEGGKRCKRFKDTRERDRVGVEATRHDRRHRERKVRSDGENDLIAHEPPTIPCRDEFRDGKYK